MMRNIKPPPLCMVPHQIGPQPKADEYILRPFCFYFKGSPTSPLSGTTPYKVGSGTLFGGCEGFNLSPKHEGCLRFFIQNDLVGFEAIALFIVFIGGGQRRRCFPLEFRACPPQIVFNFNFKGQNVFRVFLAKSIKKARIPVISMYSISRLFFHWW